MKLQVFLMAALLAFGLPAAADDEIAALLRQANDLQENNRDSSSAERLLKAVLERDPNNPHALWQLLHLRIFDHLGNNSDTDILLDDAEALAAAGEPLLNIVRQAQLRSENDFAHFVMARYAAAYRAYDRALGEIDAALALKPDAAGYVYNKGWMLADKGKWEKDDASILAGMTIIEDLLRRSSEGNARLAAGRQAEYYFKLGWYNNLLSRPRPEKTIEYYRAAIDRYDPKSQSDRTSLAYAWHNLSNVYSRVGRCAEAQEASSNALRIMKFGAAQQSLQNAVFCSEMGALLKEEQNGGT